MPTTTMRPRSAGEILDHAFHLYRRHFGPLIVTALVTVLPLGLTSASIAFTTGESLVASLGLLAAAVVGILLWAVSWGALTRAGQVAVTGGRPDVGDALRTGFRRLPSLAAFWILLYLGLFLVVMLPLAVAGGIGAVVLQFVPQGAPQILVAVVGGLLLAAGGLLVVAWFAATQAIAVPAIVVERVGAIRGIRRGSALSKGSRLKITVLVVTCWLLTFLPSLGVLAIFGMSNALWNPEAVATLSSIEFFFQQIASIAVSALVIPFLTTVAVVIYYDQRVRREGLDIDVAAGAADVGTGGGEPS